MNDQNNPHARQVTMKDVGVLVGGFEIASRDDLTDPVVES